MQLKNQKWVFVYLIGDDVNHRRQMLARNGVVGTGTRHREVTPRRREQRDTFCFSKISEKIPIFGLLPTRAKVDFIMHENTPHFVDAFIYRFLFKTYQIRAKLVDLTRP
ncbi:MAG: hypothetical protein QMB24_00130, partial [Spirosomataceae bacterium]